MSAALCSLIAVSANPSEADRDDEDALGVSNLPPTTKFPGIERVGEGEVPAAAEMTAAPRRNAATWHRMLLCVLRDGITVWS